MESLNVKKEKQPDSPAPAQNVIRLKFSSLIVLCVSLVAATGAVMALLSLIVMRQAQPGLPADYGRPMGMKADRPTTIPPWGEFVTFDIELEQPQEYVAFEITANRTSRWCFPSLAPAQVRNVMQSCGLTTEQITRALSPQLAVATTTNTIVTPDADLVLSLSPQARAKFYTELAQSPENRYMRFPYCFPKKVFDAVFLKSDVTDDIVELVHQLCYERAGHLYFSDVETVLSRIPTEPARLKWFKALSRESAVMVRLRIRPDTDVDKLLGYWGAPGVRFKDARPLMEALKRLDEGGTMSLLYLLPPFARERLYTSPMPSYPGDPAMDCHWSTLNFFNEEPDNHFADLDFTSRFIKTNYYPVAKATVYGDLIFLLDRGGGAIHSAVYVADDIVFTKNGNNYAQPWVLMRMDDLVALYAVTDTPKVACYRHKSS